MSVAAKKRMSQPGAKEKTSEVLKEYYKTPGAKEKNSEAHKEYYKTPGAKEKQSTRIKKYFEQPGAKEKDSAAKQGVDMEDWTGFAKTENRRIRNQANYIEWRMMVFGRDDFTCQDCGRRGSYLQAHHLFSFSKWKDLRLDIDNGVTLCKECHDKYKKKGSYDHTA